MLQSKTAAVEVGAVGKRGLDLFANWVDGSVPTVAKPWPSVGAADAISTWGLPTPICAQDKSLHLHVAKSLLAQSLLEVLAVEFPIDAMHRAPRCA